MRQVLACYVLIFSMNTLGLFSQDPGAKFEKLDIRMGLSENAVTSIVQDDLGFLWLGTSNGLNRYDGYSFKVFKFQKKDDYILSGFIYKLFKDSKGFIWIGTDDGLQCFNPRDESFTHYQHSNSNKSLISNQVFDIYSTSDSILWIGAEGGLSQFNINTGTFKNFKPYSNKFNKPGFKRISAIVGDKNNLYLGTNSEILSFNLKTETFKAIKYSSNISVQFLCFDTNNNLLIGTFGWGLFSLDVTNGSYTHIVQIGEYAIPDMIQSIIKLPIGTYLGTNKGLIYVSDFSDKAKIIHYQNNVLNSGNLYPHLVSCLSYDKSGNLWVGSQQDGCFKLNLEPKAFKNYTSPVNNISNGTPPIVRTMFEFDSTHLIIGTLGSGLHLFNRKTSVFNFIKFYSNVNIDKITSVNIVKPQTILIGTEGAGLFVGKLNKSGLRNHDIEIKDVVRFTTRENNNHFFLSDYIMCSLEDRNHQIWVGTWGGLALCKLTPGGELKVVQNFENVGGNNSLVNNNILCISQDVHGIIWAGTRKGLSKISLNKNGNYEIKNYFVNQNKNNGLISNVVLSIYEDKHNRLWIGTSGGGIAYFDSKNEQFFHYTTDEKIGNNNISGILEDSKGNLWLGTSKGLVLFDPNKKIFLNFLENNDKTYDYLINSSIKTLDNIFYFGNTTGFTSFNPLEIKHRTFILPTIISGFSIYNKQVPIAKPFDKRIILENSISYTKDLTIKHDENSFTLEFTLLDLYAPDKNQYAYKLEGFDKDWVYTNSDKRFATYSNLKAGNYTFNVKGTNSDGIWNNSPTQLRIKILAPWWKTWWAKMLYAIVITLMFSLYLHYRIKLNELKSNLRFEHLEREKLNEVHQMKLRFFANISHEFRTPLTLVIAPLEKILHTSGLDKEIKYQMGIMSNNINRLLRLINQILDLARAESDQIKLIPKTGDLVNFVRSLVSSFDLKAEQQSIQLVFSADMENYMVSFDHDVFERIIYNLLSNAFNHTPANGVIDVSVIKLQPLSVEIRVKDSGVGIPKELQEKIFERFFQVNNHAKERIGTGLGLSLVKALVDIYKGTIKVNSQPGEGAEFIVNIPLSKGAPENLAPPIVMETNENMLSSNIQLISPKPVTAKSMLIVEDNIELRKYIYRNFESEYKILQADNGVEGLDMARKNGPDIIISDVMMPVMDGMEFCKKIKTDERTSHIPVLMLTALDTNESRIKGIENEADLYLTKPFNVQHLEASVKALIASRDKLRLIYSQKLVIDPSEITVTSTDEKFMRKLIALIEGKMNEPSFNIESICDELSMSRTNIHHKIKALTGQSTSEFLRTFRIKRAGQLLLKGMTVSETMYEVGINSRPYFIKSFREIFETLPSEYGKKNNTSKEEGRLH